MLLAVHPGECLFPLLTNRQNRSCLLSLPSGHSDCLVSSAVCCDAFVPTREGSVPVTALLLSQLQPQMTRAAPRQLMAPPCGPRQLTMAVVWAQRAGEVQWTRWLASTVVMCLGVLISLGSGWWTRQKPLPGLVISVCRQALWRLSVVC